MGTSTARRREHHGVGAVLKAGGRLFMAGLPGVFPWVLAAELVQLLPIANGPGGLLDTDLSLFLKPDYIGRALLCGAIQAFLYTVAVLRLAGLAGSPSAGNSVWSALRATPAVLLGYLVYEILVLAGLGVAAIAFMLGAFVLGPLAGLVLCVLPLAPTAVVSTALALFIFPAVLERRGPIASLQESRRLARSAWVRVTAVISVPALVLLLAILVGDAHALNQDMSSLLQQMDQLQGQDMDAQLQSALGTTATTTASRWNGWELLGTLLGAFAWWYTLAVCYAQYRALKDADSAK